MNDRDGDITTGNPDEATPVTPSASTDSRATEDAPQAHTLPHVTGSSDARYVSAAPLWMAQDDNHQAYDSATGTPSADGGDGARGTVPPTFGRAPSARRSRKWLALTGAAAAVVIVAGAAGGGAYAAGRSAGSAAAQAASERQALELLPQLTRPGTGSNDSTSPFGGSVPQGGQSQGGSTQGGSTQQGTSTQTSATAATDDEKAGVVTIVSTLNYDAAYKSAGTGMILTSGGLILTNNHVVQGATSIQVTVESTGESYTADVVGTDATNDVAVLKLQDATGLTPVSFDASADVATGDTVHSTGNAEGTGDLVTAEGTVLATDQSITVQSESGSGTESLSGLIEVDADVVSGDSGGPLRDGDGDVVGIVTAASQGSSTITGYAIPIDHALAIAKQIQSGTGSSTVQIGLPAFLGAQISSAAAGTAGGVTIAGTVEGSAAASAGLVAGDVVTAVDGTAVADSSALTAAIRAHESGDQVSLSWTDTAGTSHTATVTLGDGPAA
ncbi:S1C family serine protease [Frigoribacterium sp. VKM Ac-2836]|uniref:S1C family serine protease n=1 Tax=Frigoribacterium sp. VKM Ac-2836 TaxID=2739014 RepID=UPI001567A534|nr:trypsin-like peptidase domain-containing protein [Frigoribacterium sp. VKM Ac-2836]NRD26150.1 trypsin-like peptidase domain-containing protein [Frigoribacterium sp. VKM Ac-2836]